MKAERKVKLVRRVKVELLEQEGYLVQGEPRENVESLVLGDHQDLSDRQVKEDLLEEEVYLDKMVLPVLRVKVETVDPLDLLG